MAGIAWTGVLCYPIVQYRTSISLYAYTDLGTALTIAHEIGHNINMKHDFDNNTPGYPRICPTDSSSCTNIGGIMDYFQEDPNKWTCCSRYDYTEYFNQYNNNNNWCLQKKEEEITTTILPITTRFIRI